MLFNSLQFLIFFPIVIILYYLLKHRYRWLLLLVASCVFYAAFIPSYLLILFAVILIDYFAAQGIERSTGRRRKLFLLISIVATCTLLFFFKYFNFVSVNIGRLATLLHWNYTPTILKLILPIGLSFHTFQSLSYVIEVYRGHQKAERNLGIYSVYVMFFPQLVAGPIERPQNLLHQFHEPHHFNNTDVKEGLRLMLLGYFKKMVIADNLAPYVDQVYAHPAGHTGNMTLIAVYFFAIQIYCDFSGYSDIAIGAARVMGIKLMTNFNLPYFSKSVTEFWRRWHISLSTWFRDYIYIPLGGNRVSRGRMFYNLFLVFILSALWHGAGWTFVAWGMLHWLFLVTGIFIATYFTLPHSSGLLYRIRQFLSILITFHLVAFAWIFFRASSMHNALAVIRNISFRPVTFLHDLQTLAAGVHAQSAERPPVLFLGLSLLLFFLIEYFLGDRKLSQGLNKWPLLIRWTAYYTVIFWILLFGVYDVTPNFIYFQF